MRILDVVVRYPPYRGGVEHAAHELARRWVLRGHTVRVLCAAEPPGPVELDGVTVRRLPYRGKIGNTNLCWGLGRALAQEEADVLHIHLPTAGFAERPALHARRRGWPVVLSYYNDLVGIGFKGVLAKTYNRWVLPRLLGACDRVVVARSEAAGISPLLGSVGDRLARIPLGVDLERFGAVPLDGHGPLRVGFLGLLDEHHDYKGLDVLLQAVARSRRAGTPVVLEVGGEGSRRRSFERRAMDLGLEGAVRWRGSLPAGELPDFYHSLDVFALPSTDVQQEGFGLVLLEAMACGRPVLTTPVAGMWPEIAAAAAGTVVPAGDVEALASAMDSMSAQRAALAQAGRRARSLVERSFSWDASAAAYEELFAELVAARRNRTSR